ncbi:MAG: pyridoxal-phosphate dependent enzyme [Candidatus Sumerlaeaceae bacterium]|nr:pyridoxal-phosphate dependent enzyme [Candidatus Sumerlaeaceae bacterium]
MSKQTNKLKLSCVQCGREYPWSFAPQCADCNGALVDVDYNLENARIGTDGPPMVRYFDFLPIASRDSIIDGGEGNTPCFHAKELGKALGLNNLYIKNETANPTRTTKDRQGSMAVATFRELGVTNFCTSSTGNSCTALARIVSRYPDMQMNIFVGDEFLRRLNWVGAPNVKVFWLKNGTFVDAQNAAKWYADQNGFTSERGFFFFGKREALKVAYMEAVEQIPKPIDHYFQGASSAMGIYSTYKASLQLQQIGRIKNLPKLVGVQEETCNPMVRSWEKGLEKMDPADVIARPRGLSKATLRGSPINVYHYVAAGIRHSGGTIVVAEQDAMREMRALVKETEGLDICYTSSMTVVAARKLRQSGWLDPDAVIMLNITGADRKGEAYPAPDFVVEKDGDGWVMEPYNPASDQGILERVLRILVDTSKMPAGTELDTETRLVKGGLALDSVALLEFTLALEQEFSIEIAETELVKENFETMGAVAELIRRKINKAAVGGR